MGSDKKPEYKPLKVILYGGVEWFLSGWTYTYGKKMSQRFWISQMGKMSAITILRHNRRQKFIAQSPDGEILDVGVCKLRSDAKKMSQNAVSDFFVQCEIPLSQVSQDFKTFIEP